MLNRKILIIAEVKTLSPFGFKSDKPWDELFEIANRVGDVISIHTDPRWGGAFELITKAKKLTKKPILAKGIHAQDADIEAARKAGADYVLTVGRVPKPQYRRFCWVEPISLDELKAVPSGMQVVWNSRDLKTGGLKTETFKQARRLWNGWLCQASNIRTVEDIEKGANAVLVGTHLLEFAESLGADGIIRQNKE